MRIVFLALLFPLFSFCQKTYKGTITSNNGFSPVPFATIGLIKENTGNNADGHGYFTLPSYNPKPNDSLIISSVGFATQKIALSQISDSVIHITLLENIQNLRPVIISTNKNWTKETLNDYGNCGNKFYTSSGYLSQLALPMANTHQYAILSRIKICRSTGTIFKPERTLFRIRVYDIDSLTGGPGADLCNSIIEVKSKNSSINLDVEKYQIQIPGWVFFIAVEWIKIPYNKRDSPIPTVIGEKDHYTYNPSIGWDSTNNINEASWELNFRNEWHKTTYFNSNRKALISATIKY